MLRLSALSSLLVCSLAVLLLVAAPAAADFDELAEEQLIYGQCACSDRERAEQRGDRAE